MKSAFLFDSFEEPIRQRPSMCLYVYSRLRDGRDVRKEDVLNAYRTSEASFKRCIATIRCFLQEHENWREVNYYQSEGVYRLEDVNTRYFSKQGR